MKLKSDVALILVLGSFMKHNVPIIQLEIFRGSDFSIKYKRATVYGTSFERWNRGPPRTRFSTKKFKGCRIALRERTRFFART